MYLHVLCRIYCTVLMYIVHGSYIPVAAWHTSDDAVWHTSDDAVHFSTAAAAQQRVVFLFRLRLFSLESRPLLSLSHLLHSAGRPALPSSLAPTDQRLAPTQSAIQVLLIISKGRLDGGRVRFFSSYCCCCRYLPLDLDFFCAVLTEV